ncbi:MAG: hypothetical protein JNK82_12085 [Myxococcaceae bacterium]|nr:hypothetical protein [Myxococcaceae bacterium]
MSKMLLLSSMIAMIVLPIRAARMKGPNRGLKRAITTVLLFNIAWAAVVLLVFMVKMKDPASLAGGPVNP